MQRTSPRLSDVAIVGTYNTAQARSLDQETTFSIVSKAIRGALADAGLKASDVNGLSVATLGTTTSSSWWVPVLGRQPSWTVDNISGLSQVLLAVGAIATGQCDVVVVATGQAGLQAAKGSVAPWARPDYEFTGPYGTYSTVEFALMARRHMHLYGTTREQMAEVAATIRNNGHVNPEAVFYGKGPFTPDDVLRSRPVADPFNLLDCAMNSEGGAAVVLARRDRIPDTKQRPVFIAGGASEVNGQGYSRPPVWDESGNVGAWAGERSFRMAGLRPADVDVCELYDPFSFEIIRQFEILGFCKPGEGGDFVMGGRIHLDGEFPITTDGGAMAFSHSGTATTLQRVIAGVHQIQRRAGARQVADAEVALCTVGGSAALGFDAILLCSEPN